MLSVIDFIHNWINCPKEIPSSFQIAFSRTLTDICEQERIKREWKEIWDDREERSMRNT